MAEVTSKVNLCPKCGKPLEWLEDVEDRGEKQYCQCHPPTDQPFTGEDAFIDRISEEIVNNIDLKDLPMAINKLKDRLTGFLLNLIDESENQRIRQDKHHHFLNDILNKITNNESKRPLP